LSAVPRPGPARRPGPPAASFRGRPPSPRASFLLAPLGGRFAAPAVTLIDAPLRAGGAASRPFDAEGVASRRRTVVRAGVLESYLLDSYSARRLGLRPTGHASRYAGDAPVVAPTNFFMEAGPHASEAIVGSVSSGFFVTELIGFGVNLGTGDYSPGPAGVWIEDGEVAQPVEEVTIAGNLRDMLAGIEMVGSDLVFRGAVSAPTIKIGRMTVAGT